MLRGRYEEHDDEKHVSTTVIKRNIKILPKAVFYFSIYDVDTFLGLSVKLS